MRCPILAFGLLLFAPLMAGAESICAGQDLIAALPAAERQALQAQADAVPYSRGLFWRAEKGNAQITLIGTLHYGDDRHDATVERFAPEIASAAVLLVEAGPQEEARLTRALHDDPALMRDGAGPPLSERLGPQDWGRLERALEARGVPAPIGAQLRPWYAATLLGLSPCMLRGMASEAGSAGLDHRLIAVAEAGGTPVRALEPWDTLFAVFQGMTPADEIDMIRAALPQAERADDYAVTMLGAYFDQDVWLLWEFGRQDAEARAGLPQATIERQMALMQRELMDKRNAAWMAPLQEAATLAAADGDGVVAAFGALHLPGENGILALLERDGWTVTRLE